MKETLASLVQVQKLDERIVTLQRRLDSLPVELGERESQHSALEASVEAVDMRRKEALARSKDLENDVRTWESRVQKLEQQIRNTRDPGAVQVAERECQELRDKISSSEEEALKLLELAERMVDERKGAKGRVDEAAGDLELFRKTVEADIADLEAERNALQAERDAGMKGVPPSTREVYERLLPVRNGRAIAPLKGEGCGGCGMAIPPNDRVKVIGQNTLVRCRSCTRILVMAEMLTGQAEGASESG